MARRSIREIRRAELSQAAFEELIASGIRGTTLERVAARAGVSKGVVLHHFKDKDHLFEVVMRRANAVLSAGVIELLRHTENPLERLFAVIVGNFAEPVFNQQVCHAWISLCADAPYNKANLRIQNVIHARMRSNLRDALRGIVKAEQVEGLASQISTAIDGIWLRASLLPAPLTMRDGVDHMSFVVKRLVGSGERMEARADQARAKMEMLANIILNSRAFTEKSLATR